MVTKEALERLRAERPKPQATLDYTIGGSVQTTVHARVEGERLRAIAHGDQRLHSALAKMRQNQALGFRHGLAASHFNHKTTQEITP